MAKKNKHPELDKWQKEIERLSYFEENAMNKKLFKYYRQALIDIKKEMKVFMDNYETLSFSKRLEAERLLENGKQIDKILRDMNKEVNNTIEKYVHDSAERGYYGNWYALEGITGVHLDMNMLPEKYIKELVNRPVKGQRFSKRLYKQTNKLAKQTTTALLDAARTGKSYAVAAKLINEMTEASYKQAYRIARTEGGRVQSTTKQRSYVEAKKKGVDIQKQWMSTLDKRTRHSHQHLDGQTVEIEEKFTSGGYEADGPRLFGVAAEDINCRCTTITVVNGIAPELRVDNEYGETFPYKNYKEWYNGKNSNSQSKVDPFDEVQGKIKSIEEKMKRMENGDLGGLTEAEASEVYLKWMDDLSTLESMKKKLLSKDNNQIIDIDKFFSEGEGYKKWVKSLSNSDKEMIKEYTGPRYETINEIRREGVDAYLEKRKNQLLDPEFDKKMIRIADDLAEVVGRYKTENSFTTYRGMKATDKLVFFDKKDIGSIKSLDKSYMSASLDESEAAKFGTDITYEIRVKKGLNVGAYVSGHSKYTHEKEFLFKPNTKFKILDIENKHENGKVKQNVILEVMGDD